MSDAQVGRYIRLLCLQHQTGRLKEKDLKKISRNDSAVIEKFIKDENGLFYNERLENEANKRTRFYEKQRENINKRWGESYENSHKTRGQRLAEARTKGTHIASEWEEMKSFFDNTCVICGKKEMPVEKDHIIPIYQGGSDAITNIQPACAKCNAGKGSESIDHRIIYSQQHNLIMPIKWIDAYQTCTKRVPLENENESINDNSNLKGDKGDSKGGKEGKRFVPPSLEEVQAYALSRNSEVDPKKFWEYFDTGKWIDSKGDPVRNWKQKFITWEGTRTGKQRDKPGEQQQPWERLPWPDGLKPYPPEKAADLISKEAREKYDKFFKAHGIDMEEERVKAWKNGR
jgi:5-methylcytosine-specific restriction endonuclease McrA